MNTIYRGKNEKNEWVYGSKIRMYHKMEEKIGIIEIGEIHKEIEPNKFALPVTFIDERTLGISAGIEDCTGANIFSHDIVKVSDRFNPEKYFISVVYFNPNGFVLQPPYKLRKLGEPFWNLVDVTISWKVEVIGDIFDNVELLNDTGGI